MTIRNRVRTIEKLKKKSEKNFEEAKLLYEQGFFEGAISRAYYSMFCLARAVLVTKDIFRKKHSGVTSAFGQHFTKIGLLPADLHFKILRGFEERNISDYGFETPKAAEEAKEILGFAVDFAKAVVPFLDDWIEEHKD